MLPEARNCQSLFVYARVKDPSLSALGFASTSKHRQTGNEIRTSAFPHGTGPVQVVVTAQPAVSGTVTGEPCLFSDAEVS